jgi:hypothetical protein
MAEPAFGSEDDPEESRPDPMAAGWADVRRGLITATRAVVLAAAEVARDPRSAAALEMLRVTLAAQESLGVIAGRWEVDEAVIEVVEARAFEAGRRACLDARGRLEVIDGGLPG